MDTNVVIYALGGDPGLAKLLHGDELHLSFISEVELLSYPKLTAKETAVVERFIRQMPVVHSNATIVQEAVRLRRSFGIKLPDAIIAATAIYLDIPLITADSGFNKLKDELPLFLYEP